MVDPLPFRYQSGCFSRHSPVFASSFSYGNSFVSCSNPVAIRFIQLMQHGHTEVRSVMSVYLAISIQLLAVSNRGQYRLLIGPEWIYGFAVGAEHL